MTLAARLEDARRRFAAEDGAGLTNHLPMALVALHTLGASSDRLDDFAAGLGRRLAAAEPVPRAAQLRIALAEQGLDGVLRAELRSLLPALGAAAFHGVIRTAFAARSGDLDEVAHALAYWESAAAALPAAPIHFAGSGAREDDLGALAERLRAEQIPKPTGALITTRLQRVTTDPRFVRVVDDLGVDASTLGQVSGLGARWYLAAGDFASLHVLTGAHAVRMLRPWTVDERAADRVLARAALACFVVAGSPGRADSRGLERAEDAEIKARAIASDDDHMAKLVVACFDEERAYGDVIYRIVATRAVRRGST